MVVYSLSALFAAAYAAQATYHALFQERSTIARQGEMVSFAEFEEIIGVPGWQELERRYVAE